MKEILKKSEKIFKSQRPLATIFSPDKELITDILEIKKKYKFLYVSSNIICHGISLVTTPSFLKLYEKQFKYHLNKNNRINKFKYDDKNIIKNIKKKYNFKIKEKIKGIKSKYENNKFHYSFAEGEDDIINEEFYLF